MPRAPRFFYLLVSWFGLLAGGASWAQVPATGAVVARATGAPLPQTSVRLVGQPGVGASTDEAGRFTLALPPGTDPRAARLLFSHLGYQPQEVPAAQLGAPVALAEQTYQIGEVAVTYTSVRQLLVRTWRVADESLAAAAQNLLAVTRSQSPRLVGWLTQHPTELREVLQKARITMQPDGTLKVRLGIFSSKGHWQLDEERRTLLVYRKQCDDSAPDTIVELSAQLLVLQEATPGAAAVGYVPAD